MEVILLEKVQNLGGIGARVKVRAGYGRNFLVPYGKAVAATEDNIKMFEARRADLEQKEADSLAAAEARKAGLADVTLTIASKAGDEGKLFGSIGVRDIVDAAEAAGVVLEKHEVHMPDGVIRHIGEYDLVIRLHPDVEGQIKVIVTPE